MVRPWRWVSGVQGGVGNVVPRGLCRLVFMPPTARLGSKGTLVKALMGGGGGPPAATAAAAVDRLCSADAECGYPGVLRSGLGRWGDGIGLPRLVDRSRLEWIG